MGPKIGIALVAMAIASTAASAGAVELVPPENSAVNQYTESFPTTRGNQDLDGNRGANRSPEKVLGAANTRQLERQGRDGRAAAELAAETAPLAAAPPPPREGDAGDTATGGAVGGDAGGGGNGQPSGQEGPASTPTASGSSTAPQVSGSSGIGEVLAAATGSSSSGGMGILLPLLLLGTVLWGFAYLLRQRRPAS